MLEAVVVLLLIIGALAWRYILGLVVHDRIWRINKEGFYGDPYKQPGIEEDQVDE